MATRKETRSFWAKHVEAFAASGRTRAAYCAAHGLRPGTLDKWRRRLRSAPAERTQSFVPIRVSADRATATRRMDIDRGTPAAMLQWPSGTRMLVASDADPQWLGRVLAELR